jgi:hypothetical protein
MLYRGHVSQGHLCACDSTFTVLEYVPLRLGQAEAGTEIAGICYSILCGLSLFCQMHDCTVTLLMTIWLHFVFVHIQFSYACTTERSPVNGPCWYIARTVTLSPPYLASAVLLFSPLYFPPFHSGHLVILFTWTLLLITTWKPSLLTCCLGWLPGTSGSW